MTTAPFLEQHEYLLNGTLHNWDGPFQDVTTPLSFDSETGRPKKLGYYPLLSEEVALGVLKAAEEAYNLGQGTWPTMHPLERSACIKHFVKLMQLEREQVVDLLVWEIGKTKKDAYNEFDRTVEYIKETVAFYERKVKRLHTLRTQKGITSQLMFSPLGITLCMGPYNYPLNETLTIIIPALLTGNVVIFKPPRIGVLLHQPLLQAFASAFPAGVVNTIYGEGQKVISPIMKSGKIDVFAFIGSSKVADVIKSQHPYPHRLHTVLGLEAKNPAIIFNDCDLPTTINECLLGSLSYNGQRCTALKILFVEDKISKTFTKEFATAVDKLVLGDPFDANVQLTPLPEMSRVTYLNQLIVDAQLHGAQKINKNGGVLRDTSFFPVVLYPVSLNSRLAHEEQFGPVVPIVPFKDIQEVFDYITTAPFGQQLSIFTTNERNVHHILSKVSNQVSRININSQCQRGPDHLPFTGRKDSAFGVLSVREALRAFSSPLVIAGKSLKFNERLMKKTYSRESSTIKRIWNRLKT